MQRWDVFFEWKELKNREKPHAPTAQDHTLPHPKPAQSPCHNMTLSTTKLPSTGFSARKPYTFNPPPAYIILTAPTSSTSMMTSKNSAWITIEVLQSIRKHSHFTIPSHPHITPIKNKKNSNYGQRKVHALSSPSSLKMIQSIRFNLS